MKHITLCAKLKVNESKNVGQCKKKKTLYMTRYKLESNNIV